jgi:hypothetical protein
MLAVLLELHFNLIGRNEPIEVLVYVGENRQAPFAAANAVEIEQNVRVDED